MTGKKIKVFIGILIVLTLTLISITLNANIQGIQLSPQAGIQKWQNISETNKIAYLTAIGSALFVILVIELIMLRKANKENQQNAINEPQIINRYNN